MDDPYPWLAHPPRWLGPTWWRKARARWQQARTWWHRTTHPHTDLLDHLARTGPADDLILLHPHTGHVIALACPACGLWRRDPTTDCPGCGL